MQANCRVVVTMGGGYPKDVTETSREYAAVVNAHTDVYIQVYKYIYMCGYTKI